MSLKEEMDDHNVSIRNRPKIFTWGLMGGWSTASVLLIILINCYVSRTKDAKEDKARAEQKEDEFREMAKSFMKQNLQAEAAPIMREVKEYKKSADSLSVKADTLKHGI